VDWKRRRDVGRDFLSPKPGVRLLSLTLDDLPFPNPLFASLFPTDDPDTYTLLWSRPKADR
jgi:uncharacterized protein (DUF736 family)